MSVLADRRIRPDPFVPLEVLRNPRSSRTLIDHVPALHAGLTI